MDYTRTISHSVFDDVEVVFTSSIRDDGEYITASITVPNHPEITVDFIEGEPFETDIHLPLYRIKVIYDTSPVAIVSPL